MNGWFKGVSAGTVWPDERRFYARVRAPQQLIESAATLDVLGIRYVLANADETVAGDLRMRGVIPKEDAHFVLYENSNPWPDAFVLDGEAEHIPPVRLPGCDNDSVLCTDLAPLVAARRSMDGLRIRHQNGRIEVRLFPVGDPRLLVVSQMYRHDWTASAGGARLTSLPVFGGLIGVRVPPGISSVQLRYRPVMLILATALAWCTLTAGFAALIVLRRTAGRSAPATARDGASIRD